MSSIRVTFTIAELDTISLALANNNSITSDTIKLKIGRARLGLKKSRAGAVGSYSLDGIMEATSIASQETSYEQEQESILQAALAGTITQEQKARYQELTGLAL